MTTTSVELTDEEMARLRTIAERAQKSEEQLIAEAVRDLLSRSDHDFRLSLLRSARGIWKDRTDLPDFDQLRRESDRWPVAEEPMNA